MTRLAGLSKGAGAFAAAWIVGAAIARLTGAAAVLLLLASTLVAGIAAVVSGWLAIRRTGVGEITSSPLTTVGAPTPITLRVRGTDRAGDGVVRVSHGAVVLAAVPFDELDDRRDHVREVAFEQPGIVDQLTVEILTAGRSGLVWMRRRQQVSIDPVAVAPIPAGPTGDVHTAASQTDGINVSQHGPKHGEIDGVRAWRDGDGDASVHWPSTLRAGSLIIHDREASLDQTWVVEVTSARLLPDDAARLVHTLTEGLRLGHRVVLRHQAADVLITSADVARRWGAELIGPATPTTPTTPWWKRTLHLGASSDTFTTVTPLGRWFTAVASMVALAMLIGALDSDPTTLVIGSVGLACGAALSLWMARRSEGGMLRPWWLRVGVGLGTLAALAYVASTVGGVGGLLEALRGPMPDLLMLLLVIHGFEVVDRRTLRVHQAIGGVVIAYATGLRIDDRVGLWMAAWGIVVVAAVRATTRRDQRGLRMSLGRRVFAGSAAVIGAGAATVAVLFVVPVPDGPARLGLPALSNDAPSVPTAGGLAGPSGDAPATSDGTRGALGEVGGYNGFAETMDTSVRGDLGDQVVLRVRAPRAEFWRGQTFTEFDGRFWSVSPETGRPQTGPRIEVPATMGDIPRPGSGAETEELVQTFYVEADLPNVLFAAARPDVVTFDGTVYTRPDGALRADVTLTEGSVYTVVSERVQVTSESLRMQGEIGDYFASFTRPTERSIIDPFLVVPESTTQRTIDLATDLRTPGESTYDTILAYQAWLAANTEYDLNAPVPDEGVDAVDDYLFASQRGFCEQIASSLAIMLRTQGIPARIATGYIPGVRDQVSGVFEVRASDAHAWVEVWFPDSGWQAFDPTASVPLSGEAEQASVGGEVLGAAISGITSRPVETGLVVAAALIALGLFRTITEVVRRRRRGRWGVLQDRFSDLAGPDAINNLQRADALDDPVATELAELLDRAAFDPTWLDPDDAYDHARRAIRTLTK